MAGAEDRGRCSYGDGHHPPYHVGPGGGHEVPKEPSGVQVGRCGLDPAEASETQTCTFLALSGSRDQVHGVSVNGDEDPGLR